MEPSHPATPGSKTPILERGLRAQPAGNGPNSEDLAESTHPLAACDFMQV